MRKTASTLAWFGSTLAATLLQGCGVATPELPLDDLRILVLPLAASAECPSGGQRIDAGLDLDGNGVLDAREVTHTLRLCDDAKFGAPGPTLVRVSGHAAECPGGGFALHAGPDADGDGRLGAAELRARATLCERARPGSLTRRAGSPATIAPARVSSASPGFAEGHGAAELLARIDVDAGLECDGRASRATSGIDANRNGVLDATEVALTQIACGVRAARAAAPATVALPIAAGTGAAVQVTGGDGVPWRIAQAPGQRINTEQLQGPWGSGWAPAGPRGPWTAAAQSADGRRILVAGRGAVLASHDAGASWSSLQGAGTSARVDGVAVSGNGGRLAISARDGGIQVSEDGGRTWQRRGQGTGWGRIAASSDLQRLLAERDGRELWLSRDAGRTWQRCAPQHPWTGLASSADGRILVAAARGGLLQVSEDGGRSWHARPAPAGAAAIALSADGAQLFVADEGDPHALRRSDDRGRHWAKVPGTARGGRQWTGLAVSGHGHVVVAATNRGELWSSTDGGTRWQVDRTPHAISAVAVNAEGLARLALARDEHILRAAAATTPGASGALSFAGGPLGLRHIGMGVWAALPAAGTFQVH